MFTFVLTALMALPILASNFADGEERSDPDVFRRPRPAEHEAEIITLRHPVELEILPACEREDDYGYGDALRKLRA